MFVLISRSRLDLGNLQPVFYNPVIFFKFFLFKARFAVGPTHQFDVKITPYFNLSKPKGFHYSFLNNVGK